MSLRFGQPIGAIQPLLMVIMVFGCSGGGSSAPKAEKPTQSPKEHPPDSEPKPPAQNPSPKAEKPTEPAKDHPPNSDPNPPVQKPVVVIPGRTFLGVSSDFKVYATADAEGVKVVDLETGTPLASPTWDKDWGSPLSAAFREDAIAVVTVHDSSFAIKIFSRKSGELEQNIHGDHIDRAEFTAGGRMLAITEFRSGKGYYLVLRDIRGKKTVAEVRVGGGSCSLAVSENRVATYGPDADQITIVGTKMGAVVKKFKSGGFRKTKESGHVQMALAISPAGNLLACEAEDAVVLYDIDGGKVAQKLEGHLDAVTAVGFSPNGETAASAAKDKTIRFWNVKTGKEANVIKNVPLGASMLTFSADGKKVVVLYPSHGLSKAEIRSVASE